MHTHGEFSVTEYVHHVIFTLASQNEAAVARGLTRKRKCIYVKLGVAVILRL